MAKVIAVFAVMVDLPTPPFPDAIAIIFLMFGISFPRIKFGFSLATGFTTCTFTLTTIAGSTLVLMAFEISVSIFFFACKVGLLMVTSTSTSLPKVTTLVTLLFSIKLFPSPGAVIVSNALYMSCFLKLIFFK